MASEHFVWDIPNEISAKEFTTYEYLSVSKFCQRVWNKFFSSLPCVASGSNSVKCFAVIYTSSDEIISSTRHSDYFLQNVLFPWRLFSVYRSKLQKRLALTRPLCIYSRLFSPAAAGFEPTTVKIFDMRRRRYHYATALEHSCTLGRCMNRMQIVHWRLIQTWIIGVEGKHADNWTSTRSPHSTYLFSTGQVSNNPPLCDVNR